MMRWTSVGWFRTCTTLVLAAFLSVYGVNLTTWAGISKAYALDIDALLDEDDSDLLDGIVDTPPPPPPAAPAPPAEDDDYDDDYDDKYDEDEEADTPPPPPAPAADPYDDDDYDEDDYDEDDALDAALPPASPVIDAPLPPEPARTVVLGPRKDGRTKVTPVVFGASDSAKRRAVEIGLIARSYFRSSAEFTHVGVNDALFGADQMNEDAQVSKAKRSLSRGVAAYDANRLDDAIDDLEDAIASFGPVLDYPEYRPLAVDALFYLAASLILDGDPDEGRAVFTRLLQWDRSATMQGRNFPPRVVDEFEDARDDLSRAPRASMSVTSTPSNAPVFVDGHYRGLTPISLDNLSVGEHFIKVTEPAFKDYQISTTLFRGIPKTIPATLQESTRYYQFRGEMSHIERTFEHKRMWEQVQALGKVLNVPQLFLCKVNEARGVVTLEVHYYDLPEEFYKVAIAEIDLAQADFEQAVLQFIDLVVSERVRWADAYVPPEELAAAAVTDEKTPVHKTWWLWTIVGVVVAAGAGAGIYFGLFHKKGDKKDGLPGGRDFEHPNSVLISF